jgi:N-terminal acetyltransferase B complex non-catalytic subunit
MQFDTSMSNALAFIQKLQADTNNNNLRCPYLANLEVERRKHLYGKGDDDKLMEALMQYFLRYGFACQVETALSYHPIQTYALFRQ